MQNLKEYIYKNYNRTCTRSANPTHSKISGERRLLELPLFSQAQQKRRQLWRCCHMMWSRAGQAPVLGAFYKRTSSLQCYFYSARKKRVARQQNKALFPRHIPRCAPLVSARQCPWWDATMHGALRSLQAFMLLKGLPMQPSCYCRHSLRKAKSQKKILSWGSGAPRVRNIPFRPHGIRAREHLLVQFGLELQM